MRSQSAKLAIRYRLKMNNLGYHYKNNNTDLCCPLCSKERDDMNHLVACESYGHIDGRLKLSDLYSNETDDTCRATEAVRERMEYRETQLLTKQWDSRNWRREERKKEKRHTLYSIHMTGSVHGAGVLAEVSGRAVCSAMTSHLVIGAAASYVNINDTNTKDKHMWSPGWHLWYYSTTWRQ